MANLARQIASAENELTGLRTSEREADDRTRLAEEEAKEAKRGSLAVESQNAQLLRDAAEARAGRDKVVAELKDLEEKANEIARPPPSGDRVKLEESRSGRRSGRRGPSGAAVRRSCRPPTRR